MADFYAHLRDQYEPEATLWVSETAAAACGRAPWAKTFTDVFRYLDQLGRLAKHDVEVVMHNTLSSNDYGLLEEDTFVARPNYWAAVLWQRLMGEDVLELGATPNSDTLIVYAHCTAGIAEAPEGAVTYLLLNVSLEATYSVLLSTENALVYGLSSDELEGTSVNLDGMTLTAAGDGSFGKLQGRTAS